MLKNNKREWKSLDDSISLEIEEISPFRKELSIHVGDKHYMIIKSDLPMRAKNEVEIHKGDKFWVRDTNNSSIVKESLENIRYEIDMFGQQVYNCIQKFVEEDLIFSSNEEKKK